MNDFDSHGWLEWEMKYQTRVLGITNYEAITTIIRKLEENYYIHNLNNGQIEEVLKVAKKEKASYDC